MTWQCHNVLVSTYFWNQNPPKPVIGPTRYYAKHIYKLTLYRTYSQNLRSAHVSTSVTTCLRKSNEVESRYLLEKVTSLQVERSVQKSTL